MSPKSKRRKCRCCREFFVPDYRNQHHQRYRGKSAPSRQQACQPAALVSPASSSWALYLFLVTVADVQGLSYYSDAAIGRHLEHGSAATCPPPASNWMQADLIAYHKPLYQVLALPEDPSAGRPPPDARAPDKLNRWPTFLRRALEGGARMIDYETFCRLRQLWTIKSI